MIPLTAAKLATIAARTFAAILAIEVGLLTALACTNAKGVDTAKHADFSKTYTVATTQASESAKGEHFATTQSSGGGATVATATTLVDVSRDGDIRVATTDSNASKKSPTVVNVIRDRTDTTAKTDTKADTHASNAVTDESTIGARLSGAISSAFKMDGLTVDAPAESMFKQRMPLILGLAGFGLYFTFAPITLLGNPLRGVGLLGCAALSLILSNFWLGLAIAAVVVIGFWPDLKKIRAFGRVTEVLDDWKAGMADDERKMFNASLKTAAGKDAKVVDKIRVEQKHSAAPAVVAADFQEVVMPPAAGS